MALFVAHAAALAAHAQGAGFAGVFGAQCFPKAPPTDAASHAERVTHRRPAAATRSRIHRSAARASAFSQSTTTSFLPLATTRWPSACKRRRNALKPPGYFGFSSPPDFSVRQ